MKFKSIALAVALSAAMGTVSAQQPAAQPQEQAQLTPEQQAQLARQDVEMTNAAQQVVQLIDSNRLGEVWDLSTNVVKQMLPRESFVQQVGNDRAQLGAPTERGQAVVTRTQFQDGGEVPAGLYINIAFPTRFANSAEPVRELVSFRLDEDQIWRVSGYSLR
ncbi:DUF4019 domain-containing protein [Luteimonas sp. A478]